MPTGSGKTAVLILTAFMLRSERTLVITPSVLVRDQIAEEFKSLRTLIRLGVVPSGILGPNLRTATKRISTEQDWENLRVFDVVVATPYSLSPGLGPIPRPPGNLFDLILIDEAHHAPARIWVDLLESFPGAQKVLFTATPFRRDKGEIKGRFVYSYSLRKAYEDRVFGDIRYVPVSLDTEVSADVAVALKAAETLKADRESGYNHLLMVRTDSKKRATELGKTYRTHTRLRLKVVHSGYSYAHITSTIKQLREGKLDGIICVAMLGEGFDLPELKIAAIHAPHKSLGAILQFIGRFARTASEKVGEAKFLAVPNDIILETERLYSEDAAWQDIVANLSASKIASEVNIREGLETFRRERVYLDDLSDLPLYSLEPYLHVKIYSTRKGADLCAPIKLPHNFAIVYSNLSEDLSTLVVITRETEQPKWTDQERFERAEYDLFVIYHDIPSGLMFINSSRKTLGIYETVAGSISGNTHRILPLYKINRVLRELDSIECFNIGMRNRARHASVETYRIMAGAQTQKAIGKTTGRLFNRGHVFARVGRHDELTTIGYSSGSKAWSNRHVKIPELIDWCKTIALKISNEQDFTTRSELDDLPLSSRVDKLPSAIIALDWPEEAYLRPFAINYNIGEVTVHHFILDCNLVLKSLEESRIVFRVEADDFSISILFKNGEGRLFERLDEEGELKAILPSEEIDFIDYLNNFPVSFYTPLFSRICGEEEFPGWAGSPPYDVNRIDVWDWKEKGVDIEREAGVSTCGTTIHEFLGNALRDECDVVLYDHGPGEIADFVALKECESFISISLYHCKASSSPNPGERVADIYEVAGQVIKSTLWLKKLVDLQKRIEYRLDKGSTLKKGDFATINRLVGIAASKGVRFEKVLVQPGISALALTETGLSLLGAADGYISSAGVFSLRIIASL